MTKPSFLLRMKYSICKLNSINTRYMYLDLLLMTISYLYILSFIYNTNDAKMIKIIETEILLDHYIMITILSLFIITLLTILCTKVFLQKSSIMKKHFKCVLYGIILKIFTWALMMPTIKYLLFILISFNIKHVFIVIITIFSLLFLFAYLYGFLTLRISISMNNSLDLRNSYILHVYFIGQLILEILFSLPHDIFAIIKNIMLIRIMIIIMAIIMLRYYYRQFPFVDSKVSKLFGFMSFLALFSSIVALCYDMNFINLTELWPMYILSLVISHAFSRKLRDCIKIRILTQADYSRLTISEWEYMIKKITKYLNPSAKRKAEACFYLSIFVINHYKQCNIIDCVCKRSDIYDNIQNNIANNISDTHYHHNRTLSIKKLFKKSDIMISFHNMIIMIIHNNLIHAANKQRSIYLKVELICFHMIFLCHYKKYFEAFVLCDNLIQDQPKMTSLQVYQFKKIKSLIFKSIKNNKLKNKKHDIDFQRFIITRNIENDIMDLIKHNYILYIGLYLEMKKYSMNINKIIIQSDKIDNINNQILEKVYILTQKNYELSFNIDRILNIYITQEYIIQAKQFKSFTYKQDYHDCNNLQYHQHLLKPCHFNKDESIQKIKDYFGLSSSISAYNDNKSSCVLFINIIGAEQGKVINYSNNIVELFNYTDYEMKDMYIDTLIPKIYKVDQEKILMNYLSQTIHKKEYNLDTVYLKNKYNNVIEVEIYARIEPIDDMLTLAVSIKRNICHMNIVLMNNNLNMKYFSNSVDDLQMKLAILKNDILVLFCPILLCKLYKDELQNYNVILKELEENFQVKSLTMSNSAPHQQKIDKAFLILPKSISKPKQKSSNKKEKYNLEDLLKLIINTYKSYNQENTQIFEISYIIEKHSYKKFSANFLAFKYSVILQNHDNAKAEKILALHRKLFHSLTMAKRNSISSPRIQGYRKTSMNQSGLERFSTKQLTRQPSEISKHLISGFETGTQIKNININPIFFNGQINVIDEKKESVSILNDEEVNNVSILYGTLMKYNQNPEKILCSNNLFGLKMNNQDSSPEKSEQEVKQVLLNALEKSQEISYNVEMMPTSKEGLINNSLSIESNSKNVINFPILKNPSQILSIENCSDKSLPERTCSQNYSYEILKKDIEMILLNNKNKPKLINNVKYFGLISFICLIILLVILFIIQLNFLDKYKFYLNNNDFTTKFFAVMSFYYKIINTYFLRQANMFHSDAYYANFVLKEDILKDTMYNLYKEVYQTTILNNDIQGHTVDFHFQDFGLNVTMYGVTGKPENYTLSFIEAVYRVILCMDHIKKLNYNNISLDDSMVYYFRANYIKYFNLFMKQGKAISREIDGTTAKLSIVEFSKQAFLTSILIVFFVFLLIIPLWKFTDNIRVKGLSALVLFKEDIIDNNIFKLRNAYYQSFHTELKLPTYTESNIESRNNLKKHIIIKKKSVIPIIALLLVINTLFSVFWYIKYAKEIQHNRDLIALFENFDGLGDRFANWHSRYATGLEQLLLYGYTTEDRVNFDELYTPVFQYYAYNVDRAEKFYYQMDNFLSSNQDIQGYLIERYLKLKDDLCDFISIFAVSEKNLTECKSSFHHIMQQGFLSMLNGIYDSFTDQYTLIKANNYSQNISYAILNDPSFEFEGLQNLSYYMTLVYLEMITMMRRNLNDVLNLQIKDALLYLLIEICFISIFLTIIWKRFIIYMHKQILLIKKVYSVLPMQMILSNEHIKNWLKAYASKING